MNSSENHQIHLIRRAIVIALFSLLVSCSPSTEELNAVNYSPLIEDDWPVSTPEEQGLDSRLVAEMYFHAAELETLYSLLVVKDGFLIAEKYFNGASIDEKKLIQSVSKSYLSALVGIALEEGYLSSVDQKMIEFFPEVAEKLTDPRKREISIRQMLQMRSGYPDEETDAAYLKALYGGVYLPLLEDFPLASDPGTAFHYSNLTYSWLAILLKRACGADLKDFALQHLFEPTETEVGEWHQDRDGHYIGSGGIHVTARDAAQFGLLYLRDGKFGGERVVPVHWIGDSLQTYSEGARDYGWGFAFRDLGYGYGWWSASAGDHHFNFAWGHGGQLIVLLDALDMVIVTTADPFFGQHDGNSWKHEKATFNLVGEFIESLPSQ